MGLARVIVVEDNAALRAFVGAALQGMDIDLVVCAGVAEAMQALASGPGAQLVLTDLMLHRESGMALVEQLTGDLALHKVTRVAVFSASVDALVRQRLAELGVRHILPKPISAVDLQAFVLAALGDSNLEAAADVASSVAPVLGVNGGESAEAQSIARFFAGDAELHAAFKASCILQFHDDVLAGDAACQSGDAHGLRRLGHSLATVLDTLGYAATANLAHELDGLATAGDQPRACEAWRSLRTGLVALCTQLPEGTG